MYRCKSISNSSIINYTYYTCLLDMTPATFFFLGAVLYFPDLAPLLSVIFSTHVHVMSVMEFFTYLPSFVPPVVSTLWVYPRPGAPWALMICCQTYDQWHHTSYAFCPVINTTPHSVSQTAAASAPIDSCPDFLFFPPPPPFLCTLYGSVIPIRSPFTSPSWKWQMQASCVFFDHPLVLRSDSNSAPHELSNVSCV